MAGQVLVTHTGNDMITTKTLLFILTYACAFAVKSSRGNSSDYMLIDVIDNNYVKFVVTDGAKMLVTTVSLKNHVLPAGSQYLIHRAELEVLKDVVSKFKINEVLIYSLGKNIVFAGDSNFSATTTRCKFPNYNKIFHGNKCKDLLLFNTLYLREDTYNVELAILPI